MKKTILITLLALLGMTQAVAQEYEYVPFVREGVKWVYFYIYKPGYYVPGPELKVYLTLEFKGDTVINGKTYKAMHKYFGESINESNDTVPVYMREENKVVYGIVPNGKTYSDCPIGIGGTYEIFDQVMHGEEFILYDFNDPAAYFTEMLGYNYEDEEDTLYYSVTSVDTIKAGNRLVRKFNIGYNDSSRSLFAIVEGIGFDSMTRYGSMTPGLIGYTLFPIWKMPIGGETRYFAMSHVIENGEIVYKASDYEEPQPDPDEYEYVPFVREGVKWVYRVHNDSWTPNPALPAGTFYFNLEFKGDTIINGKTYKAMHKYFGDAINEENDTVPIYMREEDKVVYGIIPDGRSYTDCPVGRVVFEDPQEIYSGNEFIMYDFNDPLGFLTSFTGGLEGDTYSYYEHQYTDTIAFGNHLGKRYNGTWWENSFRLIEGIGQDHDSSGYTLYIAYPIGMHLLYFNFSHVIENGEIIYKGFRYREEDFDGIGEVVADKTRCPLDANYYNLMGQPVGKDVPTVPGIYIHQGKKIVVR